MVFFFFVWSHSLPIEFETDELLVFGEFVLEKLVLDILIDFLKCWNSTMDYYCYFFFWRTFFFCAFFNVSCFTYIRQRSANTCNSIGRCRRVIASRSGRRIIRIIVLLRLFFVVRLAARFVISVCRETHRAENLHDASTAKTPAPVRHTAATDARHDCRARTRARWMMRWERCLLAMRVAEHTVCRAMRQSVRRHSSLVRRVSTARTCRWCVSTTSPFVAVDWRCCSPRWLAVAGRQTPRKCAPHDVRRPAAIARSPASESTSLNQTTASHLYSALSMQ